MRPLFLLLAAVLSVAAKPAPKPAAPDWTRTVAATAEGGFRLGNPAAPVKLVEFASYTCSHCAHFAAEGVPALRRDYIRSGRVSLEFRPAVRDRYDLAAALLARCAGPRGFWPLTEQMFAAQGTWLQKAQAFEDTAAAGALASKPPGEALFAVADGAGLLPFAAAAGVAPARARACVADPAAQGAIARVRADAWEVRRIPGTPAFLLNGALVDGVADWAGLEPRLRAALR